jgi:hypothetical protein
MVANYNTWLRIFHHTLCNNVVINLIRTFTSIVIECVGLLIRPHYILLLHHFGLHLLLTNTCGGSSLIQSVNFRTKHKLMLEQLHRVVSTHQIRIDPRFKGATTKRFGDIYDLDKKQSNFDLLDALRLSLLCLRSNNN